MNKIRTFFGLGRRKKKKQETTNDFELPDNYIVGSTDQKKNLRKPSESIE